MNQGLEESKEDSEMLPGVGGRIWEEKVLLVVDQKRQEEGCLAQEVLQEQVGMGWPGLG